MLPPPSHMSSSSHLMGASLALSFRPFLRCKLQLEERNFLFCVLIHSLSSAFNTKATWYYAMFSSAKCDCSSFSDQFSSWGHILITCRKALLDISVNKGKIRRSKILFTLQSEEIKHDPEMDKSAVWAGSGCMAVFPISGSRLISPPGTELINRGCTWFWGIYAWPCPSE